MLRQRRGRAFAGFLLFAACTSLESADDRFGPPANAGTSGNDAGSAGAGAVGGVGAVGGTGAASGFGAASGNGGVAGTLEVAGEAGEAAIAGSVGTNAGSNSGGSTGDGGEAGDPNAGGSGGCPPLAEREVVELGPGEVVIDDNTTWACDTVHTLDGTLVVAPGATLTLEAGSVVRVARGGLFLVQRRGRLVASGSARAPIVFTSALAEGERAPGDWRGVVLIGDGPSHAVNVPVYNTLSDGRADFGGGPEGDPDGDCGTLRYVRVEFGGGSLGEAANPGAALTLAGCGSQTQIDFVQVHRATDGIGLLGGTAALRHVLVSSNARGDCIEWTGGYRGDLQFVIAQSLGAATALLGSNSDNDPLAEPVSNPRIYNALLAGSTPLVTGAHFGLALQFGSRVTLKNSVITGFADAAFDLRLPNDVLTNEVGPGRALDISHILLDANAQNYTSNAAVLAAMASMREGEPGLPLATERTMPSFLPTGSEVLIEPTPAPRPFDTTAAFRGALAPNDLDWTLGWTAFPAD